MLGLCLSQHRIVACAALDDKWCLQLSLALSARWWQAWHLWCSRSRIYGGAAPAMAEIKVMI